jgi:hypothetical protein
MDDRLDSRAYTRAALFVDFDNIYLSIEERDPRAAQIFATDPQRWVDWFEESLGPVGPRATNETPRVVLQRNCYLNPASFSRYRSYFTRAGFRIVDCPPLTRQNKNSADIHIVLDALDVLAHPTYYDEIIILSLDADFTPLFLRLRAHDRRVVMLGSGPAAAAMRRSCDYVIPDEIFFEEALLPSDDSDPATATVEDPALATPLPSPVTPTAVATATSAVRDSRGAPVDLLTLRRRIQERVRTLVRDAPAPLHGAGLGAKLRNEFGAVAVETKWAGAGSLKALVQGARGPALDWCPHHPGYVADPSRHLVPARDADGWSAGEGPADPLVEQIARVLDFPRLRPPQWRTLLGAVAAALSNDTLPDLATRERAATEASGATPTSTRYVVDVLRLGDYDLTAPEHPVARLSSAFAASVVRLAEAAQVQLTPEDTARLSAWLSGGLAGEPPS